MVAQHLPASFLLVLFFSSIFYLPSLCAAGNESFVFSGFDGAAATGNLTLDGAANVSSRRFLELTNDGVNVKGHAFYRTPLRFKESPDGTVRSFSAIFVFAIISNLKNVSTDGMAFLVSPTKNLSDASEAQYMGFLNSKAMKQTVAIELDTVQNIADMQDIDANHVGIDIASVYSTPASPAGFYAGGTLHELNLGSGKAMQVWVDYDGRSKQLSVTLAELAPMGVDKPSKPLLSNTTDLSAVLTEEAYVGFSAGTGPFPSRHCVLAWSFAIDGPAPPIDYNKLPKLPSGRKTLPKALQIALAVAGSVLVVVAGVVAILVFVRRRQAYDELREDWEVEFGPHRFAYKDLFVATEGFKSKNILGVGGFGKVYKGILPKSKSEVAVKRVSHDSSQGIREFISEVVSIGHLRHRNLVQLLGYCRRRGELLLVYDYMANGSLDKYLYGDEEGGSGRPVLEWGQRFRVVKDVASGLFYLHEKWDKVVVHRDVKASNVLLDSGMNARLGDFGLARLYDHGADLQTCTHVVGTMGYIAPELARSGKASPLTDVFAFGTFLLEVACGRRPVSGSTQHGGGRKLLVDRVLEYWHRGALMETVDPKMQGSYDADEARLVLTLGLMCSHPFPGARPTMRQVMQYLEGDAPLPELTPANLSLLSMMQSEGVSFDQSVLQYPWSAGTSVATMTPEISVGR